MKVYEFSIVLKSPPVKEADCDALYEAGCGADTIATRNGVTHIAFDRVEMDALV